MYKSPDGKYYQLPWKSNPVRIFFDLKEFAKAGIRIAANPPLRTSRPSSSPRRGSSCPSGAANYAIYPGTLSEFFSGPRVTFLSAVRGADRAKTQLVEAQEGHLRRRRQQGGGRFLAADLRGQAGRDQSYDGDAFADGTAAMATVGPWAIANYKGEVDWGVVPVPTLHANTGPSPTFSDAKNIAMYASCQNRATAWDFLKYSTSAAQDGKLLAMTGQMPMRQGMQQLYAAYFKANPAYKEFAAEAAHVIEVPIVPNSVEIWQAFRDAWSTSVIFGQESPRQGLASAASKINQLATGNGEP